MVESGPCVKCGNEPNPDNWVSALNTFKPEYIDNSKSHGSYDELRFTCPMCGYAWTKPCADAKPEMCGYCGHGSHGDNHCCYGACKCVGGH
jgi:hypothetical protein